MEGKCLAKASKIQKKFFSKGPTISSSLLLFHKLVACLQLLFSTTSFCCIPSTSNLHSVQPSLSLHPPGYQAS